MFRVQEVGDLFVDVCVREPESGALRFLSIYGRDGALLKFFASFTLTKEQGGLSEFTLLGPDGSSSKVDVSEPSRLEKLTGKLPRGNLFGNLAQAWLYDCSLAQPDRANATAWGLFPRQGPDGRDLAAAELEDRLWQQVRNLSPVPLANEWRAAVMGMEHVRFVRWLRPDTCPHPPLGPIQACRIELGTSFVKAVSALVKEGVLQVPAA
jgi:hypothetical protein